MGLGLEDLDIKYSRLITGPLVGVDIFLGVFAAFFSASYMSFMHSAGAGCFFMLQRTAMIWLFFAIVQLIAFIYPKRLPAFVFLVGMLRIMEVPADIVYYFTTSHTFYGNAIILAPVLNTIAGTFLVYLWHNHNKE